MVIVLFEIYNKMDIEKVKTIDLSNIIRLCLLFICSLNLGILYDFGISKLWYFPLFFLYSVVILHRISHIRIKTNKWYFFLTFSLFIAYLRFEIPHYFDNIIFVSIFIFHIAYLNIANGAVFNVKNIVKWLNFTLLTTLILSILHLFVGPGTKGWIWPVNIALQELTILGLLYSKILISGIKKSYVYIFLFLFLVSFRESGKATFGALVLGLYLMRSSPNLYSRLRFQRMVFYLIYVFQLVIVIVITFVIAYLESQPQDSILRFFLNRRVILIDDGSNFITSNLKNLLIGGGFDVSNYFDQNKDITFENAPQLFILTSGVFGGLLFVVSLIGSLGQLFWQKVISNPNEKAVTLVSFFISFSTVNTFHEYINNPFIIFSISLVLISYNSVNEKNKYFNYNSHL